MLIIERKIINTMKTDRLRESFTFLCNAFTAGDKKRAETNATIIGTDTGNTKYINRAARMTPIII